MYRVFPGSSVGKESAYSARGQGLIPTSGRSPGGGHGNPLQYSCLETPMDGEAWQATVHGVTRVGHDFSDQTTTRMYNWIPFLNRSDKHNIVNQLYCNKKGNKTKHSWLKQTSCLTAKEDSSVRTSESLVGQGLPEFMVLDQLQLVRANCEKLILSCYLSWARATVPENLPLHFCPQPCLTSSL